jgi:basic membrane lipoprotein Med (substrate-binding protein (PBP1-ABC) superfamily)
MRVGVRSAIMNTSRLLVAMLLPLWGFAFCSHAEIRVAMVLPGSANDKGWNQMAREGLDRIKSELKAQTQIVTNVKSADFYSRISNFAEDGFDVVICHGGEFEKVVKEAAKNYPKTHFIVGGCSNEIPGAISVEFSLRDASELAGLVAGSVTRTKKVAYVGAEPVAIMRASYEGVKEGLKKAAGGGAGGGGGATLLRGLWTNSWDSPTLAREKTEAAIASGADVVFQNVDAASIGVFQAVQDANKSGKHVGCFGCNSNQNAVAPDVILGSVAMNIPQAYLDLARDAASGKQKNGHITLGLAGGYVDLVLNEKHPDVTATIKEKVEALRKELLKSAK